MLYVIAGGAEGQPQLCFQPRMRTMHAEAAAEPSRDLHKTATLLGNTAYRTLQQLGITNVQWRAVPYGRMCPVFAI